MKTCLKVCYGRKDNMTSKKIILIAELSQSWNDGWYYKTGLEQNGHEVIPVNADSADNSEEKVLRLIKERRPDFLFHLKDELPAASFEEFRKEIRVIQWYPDPVIPDWLPAYVKASDVFLTMSEGLVGKLREFNPHVFWLSQAFEPSAFAAGEITDKDRELYSCDVTFVGNLGSKPQYLPRRTYLKSVLDHGFDLKWWGPRMPRKFSTVPFIFGKLGRAYGGRLVWGEEHAKISKLSRIYLGFDSKPDLRKSMSERIYIAVGCGAFYMCLHVDGIEEILEPDREIVTFESEEEMIDKIKYYLKHDELRRKIAEAGQKRVFKEHTYDVRTAQMIKIIEDII